MSTHRRARQAAGQSRSANRRAHKSLYCRTLRHEPLEERRMLATVTVTTLADTIDFNDGVTSLREAIFATNTVPGADTVEFAASLTANGPATILLTQGELKITDFLTINGPGRDLLTLDASGNDPTPTVKDGKGTRVLNIDDNSANSIDCSISGCRVTGGDTSGSGGGIFDVEKLTLKDMRLDGNTAALSGGGLFASVSGNTSYVSSDSCDIIGNSSKNGGGGGAAIKTNDGANISITESDFRDNSAPATVGNGGGLQIIGGAGAGQIILESNEFSANSTSGTAAEGGGAYVFRSGSGDLSINYNRFVNNSTKGTDIRGGGIYAAHNGTGNLLLTGNFFSKNTTGGTLGDGGGACIIRSGSGVVSISDNQFVANTAKGNGGALYVSHAGSGNLVLADSLFFANSSTSEGGGAYLIHKGTGNAEVSENQFSENATSGTIANGGGLAVYKTNSGTATIVRNNATANLAAGTIALGIGIFASAGNGSAVFVRENIATNNVAPAISSHPAGAFGIASSTTDGGRAVIENNSASANRGGISATGQGLTEVNNNIATENSLTGISLSLPRGGIIHSGHNVSRGNAGNNPAGMSLNAQQGALITVADSTVSHNNSENNVGGILVFTRAGGSVQIRNSTVDNNRSKKTVSSEFTPGGGLRMSNDGGSIVIDQCTISTNLADNDGGGVWVDNATPASILIRRSTITQNIADADRDGFGNGGGIYVSRGTINIDHTIVAGNYDAGGAPDTFGVVKFAYSLIGVGADYLGPLADNGGPTMTHALLPGSPAIDAGDPAAIEGVNGVPFNDQRGAPFTRVYGGRIDVGAFELQPTDVVPGDFNRDGGVDAADYVIWRRQLGSTVPAGTGADANGDGVVGDADYAIWWTDFGLMKQLHVVASSGSVQASAVAETSVGLRQAQSGERALPDVVPRATFSSIDDRPAVELIWPTARPNATPVVSGERNAQFESSISPLRETGERRASARQIVETILPSEAAQDDGSLQIAIDDAFAALETRVAGTMSGRGI